MSIYDDPNREAVGLDPAWVEGTGGVPGDPQPKAEETAAADSGSGDDLDAMTKDQLLAYAQQIGVSPANASMTKDELRAGIDAHQAA